MSACGRLKVRKQGQSPCFVVKHSLILYDGKTINREQNALPLSTVLCADCFVWGSPKTKRPSGSFLFLYVSDYSIILLRIIHLEVDIARRNRLKDCDNERVVDERLFEAD